MGVHKKMRHVAAKHPNATAAGSSGFSVAGLFVVLAAIGVTVPPAVVAFAVAAVPTVVLWVGRDGIRGLIRRVWRGSQEEA